MNEGEPPGGGIPPGGSPTAEIAYGVTKAVLDRLWQSLSTIPGRLTNRDIAFIGDPETRRRVKEKKATAEYADLRKYVEDDTLWAVVASGLALRDLEADPLKRRRLEALRVAIHSAHGPVGVQIAEIVQRGILTDIIGHYAKQGATEGEIRAGLRNLLSDLMSHIEFIQTGAPPLETARKLTYKVSVCSPQIVMGRGYAADALRRIAKKLGEATDCHCELRESGGQTYLFVFRSDDWQKISKTDSGTPPRAAPPRARGRGR